MPFLILLVFSNTPVCRATSSILTFFSGLPPHSWRLLNKIQPITAPLIPFIVSAPTLKVGFQPHQPYTSFFFVPFRPIRPLCRSQQRPDCPLRICQNAFPVKRSFLPLLPPPIPRHDDNMPPPKPPSPSGLRRLSCSSPKDSREPLPTFL